MLGTLDTPGLASHTAASDQTLFVADGSCGVRAVDVSDPRAPQERGFWLTGFTGDVALSENDIASAMLPEENEETRNNSHECAIGGQ